MCWADPLSALPRPLEGSVPCDVRPELSLQNLCIEHQCRARPGSGTHPTSSFRPGQRSRPFWSPTAPPLTQLQAQLCVHGSSGKWAFLLCQQSFPLSTFIHLAGIACYGGRSPLYSKTKAFGERLPNAMNHTKCLMTTSRLRDWGMGYGVRE